MGAFLLISPHGVVNSTFCITLMSGVKLVFISSGGIGLLAISGKSK